MTKEVLELVPKQHAEEPIKIPLSPFWQVFKRFGRDESLAMVLNVLATAIVSFFTSIPIFLALSGPVIEKFGFFPANFLEARQIYKTTPEKQRKSMGHYFKLALKNSMKSLTEDILIHDPLYILFMFAGLIIYPSTPAWILAAISFIIAVIIVSFLEVAYVEIQYWRFKRKCKRAGFAVESYYETRFFISSKTNPKELLNKISKNFKFEDSGTVKYHDKYFENNLSEYSGRTPYVRLRRRENNFEKGYIQTVQIVYTRARESYEKKYEQYRFFPMRKDKIYYLFQGPMPKTIMEINNTKLKKILKGSSGKPTTEIKFQRDFARNDELLVTVDKLNKNKDYFLVEIKSRKDTKILIEAMRYIMREFPVVQTTKSKLDLRN